MANIILPQVNILTNLNDSSNILIEQDGEIYRYSYSDIIDFINTLINTNIDNLKQEILGGEW